MEYIRNSAVEQPDGKKGLINEIRERTSCKQDSIVSTVWIFIRGILSKKLKLN